MNVYIYFSPNLFSRCLHLNFRFTSCPPLCGWHPPKCTALERGEGGMYAISKQKCLSQCYFVWTMLQCEPQPSASSAASEAVCHHDNPSPKPSPSSSSAALPVPSSRAAAAGCAVMDASPTNAATHDHRTRTVLRLPSLRGMLLYLIGKHILLSGPFHGAIAVPSVTRCRCRRRCRGHWCAGGARQYR